jgi:tRNA-binding protein
MSDTPGVISFEDFTKVELRTARIVEAHDHPNADKLIVLTIDLGGQQRQLCAGLKGHYTPEQLVGKTIVVVANLAPRTMRGVTSQGMLLAAVSEDHSKVILLTTDAEVPAGLKVS